MKWIIALVAAVLITSGIVYWKNQQGSGPSGNDGSGITSFVPADTLYFMGSRENEAYAQFFSSYYIGGSPGTYARMMNMAIDSTKDAEKPVGKFFHSLLKRFDSEADGTILSAINFFGLSTSGEAAVFSHGLTPVIKFPLADESRFNAVIEDAVKESGFQYQTLTLHGKSVKVWPIPNEQGETTLSVGLLLDGRFATLTLFGQGTEEATQLERFGLTLPKRSLANSGELDEILSTHQISDFNSGFIHFERIANVLSAPEESLAGRELLALLSDSEENINELSSPECAADLKTLARSAPRAVFGDQQVVFANDQLDVGYKFALEVTNNQVVEEFKKIRGHVASHALVAEDKIASLAYGVNFDQLTPALTNLWTSFTQLELTCPNLVAIQEQVKGTHPMMLGMFLGMVQGIKGVAFSLYDVDFSAGLIPSDLSALLTITAENPEAVVGLKAMSPIPELANLDIPTDGTAVAITLPLLPPNINLQAAIKGKHLAIFTGTDMEQHLDRLAAEGTEPNGNFALGLNYDNMAKLFANTDLSQFPGMAGDQSQCLTQLEIRDSFTQINGNYMMHGDFTDKGWQMIIETAMKKPTFHDHVVSGAYEVQTMNDYCQWQLQGTITFTPDHSGTYMEGDFSGKCNLLERTLRWEQTGAKLHANSLDQKTREDCNMEFIAEEFEQSDTCFMSDVSKEGFICQYVEGEAITKALKFNKSVN